MIKLTERYSIENLSDCVCLITKVDAIDKKTKKTYLKEVKRYYPNIKMALKWFVSNYVEDNLGDADGIIKSVNEAIKCIEDASDRIKELL